MTNDNDDFMFQVIKKRIQDWLDQNPDRGYVFSDKYDSLIRAMIARKKKRGHDKYYCPCMVVKDAIEKEYNDTIECIPCLFVRDPVLASTGIEKEGRCHCGMLVKVPLATS